jgi:CheY-like chemotaxis protein
VGYLSYNEAKATAASDASHQQEKSMAGNTILIIEDNTLHCEELAAILQPQGFQVLTATEGNEALNKLSNGPVPHLILLDMLIPNGRDGWWFLQQRQRIPELAAVPVIIMTSLSVASEAWAASLGATSLVRKPFDAPVLFAEIRRCLASKQDSPMSSDKRILVVEDDALTAGAVKMVLEWEGFHVDCVANGQEALNRLRQPGPKPDLILLDLMMPVMDGQQFREEQKRDPAINYIPVVVVSAVDIASSVDASGHIQKPFLPKELLEAIWHQI